MTRLPDWQARLNAFLCLHAHNPFVYGTWDCCLFVCDAIREMTGVDPAEELRGKYKSRREAYALIKAAVGSNSVQSIVETVTTKVGMPEIPVRRGQGGDIALIERANDYSLGLIAMNWSEIIVCRARGLYSVPIKHGIRAWRV